MFEVIPGYTRRVKTAISIPDETFARAEQHAAALGMSRSEFFTRAVRRYIEQLEAESLTGRINLAVDMAWPDGVTFEVVQHGQYHRHDRRPAAGGAELW
jgi:predicted DNA-binding protein